MFDLPPKCPALANKLTGIFGWRHTYKVSAKHEGIQHAYLQKSYSLTLPTKRPPSPYSYIKVIIQYFFLLLYINIEEELLALLFVINNTTYDNCFYTIKWPYFRLSENK